MEIAIGVFFLAIFGGAASLALLMWFLWRRRPRIRPPQQFSGSDGSSTGSEFDRDSDDDDSAYYGTSFAGYSDGYAVEEASAQATVLDAGPAEAASNEVSDSGSDYTSSSDYDSGSGFDSGSSSDTGSGSTD